MPQRARTYDPDRVRGALLEQAWSLRGAVRDLKPEDWARPTRLGDWTVHELVVHLARQLQALPRVLADDPPAQAPDLPLVRWVGATAALAGRLDDDTRATAARTPDAAALLDAAVRALEAAVAEPLPARAVAVRPGTMTAADFAVTRLVEMVVHADDLAAATGVDVPLERWALGSVVRLLADALAAKAPGGSVELRVPPYAVVQCVAGPRHTRGTPPNVVETDPLTWIRLATGRVTWAEAHDEAALTASGERSDLTALLPLLG
ncbi:maleylpyruvate isomerase family mycothiol-dependent enzyme [Streptomyces capparidis]